MNILLDSLDTTTNVPSIDLAANTITNNAGRGIAFSALDMSINNLLVRNSTFSNNTGGDGIFLNLDNQSGAAQTANRIEITGTTSDANAGNGATVVLNNMTVGGDFSLDSSILTNNTGGGLAYLATNSTNAFVNVSDSNISTNAGGDGVLLSLDNSATTVVNISGSGINGNGGNGINIDANASPIGTLNIADNSGGTTNNIGLGFLIDGNTFPIAGTPAWSIANSSDPGILLTGFTFDVAPSSHVYNTVSGGAFPFTPELGSDATTGLTTVNGTAVPPYPDDLVPDFSTLLDLAFADFQPGETFSWNIDADNTPGSDDTVLGNELIGSTITVNFSGGLFLSGALVAVPGNDDAAQFVATGGNNVVGGISSNAGDGIRLNLANGSDVGAMNVSNNILDANGANGIELAVADSTLPDAATPITIADNTITNHAAGDGIRMITPDTNGAAIGMDLTGNTISNNTGGNGVNVQLNGNAGALTSNVTGNVVNGNGQNGFRYDVTDTAAINVADFSGNTVNGNLAGMGVNITGNLNSQVNFQAGVSTATSGANVINGNVDAGIGVRLQDNAVATLGVTNTTISNTVDGANAEFNGSGLQVITDDNARVNSLVVGAGNAGTLDSQFTNNAGSGVSLQLGVQSAIIDPVIQTSNLSGNGDDGLEIVRFGNAKIDNIQITNNQFNNNASDGVEFLFQGGNVDIDTLGTLAIDAEIAENDFNSNGGNGILVDLDANVNQASNIHNNTINASGVDGVRIRGRFDSVFNGTLTDNTMTNGGRDGVNITLTERAEAGAIIEDSQISGNVRDGIRVETTNTALVGGVPIAQVLIQNNEPFFPGDTRGIHHNGGTGINLIAASVSTQNIEIDNSLIGQNGVDGIAMTVSDFADMGVTATNNVVLENGQHGVNMNTSGFAFLGATLTDNTILRNTRRGVSLVNTGDADTNLTIQGTVDPVPSSGTNATSRIAQNGEIGVYIENNAGGLNTNNNINLSLLNTAIVGNGTNTTVASDDRNGVWIRVGTSSFGHVNADVDHNFFSGNGNVDFVTQSFTATPDPGVASQYTNPGAVQADPLARLGLSLTNNRGDEIDVTRFGATYSNADAFKSPQAFFDSASRLRNAQRFTDSFVVVGSDTVQGPDQPNTGDPAPSNTAIRGTQFAGGLPNQTYIGLGLNFLGSRDITGYNLGNDEITFAPGAPGDPTTYPGANFSIVATNISGIGDSTFRSRFNSVLDAGNSWGNVISDFNDIDFLGDGPGGNPDDDVFNQTFTWDTPFANPFY
jgi:hypothetical protein